MRIKHVHRADAGRPDARSITSSVISITTCRTTEQPYMFQDGAHDGFHEAIGDTVNAVDDAGVPRSRSA